MVKPRWNPRGRPSVASDPPQNDVVGELPTARDGAWNRTVNGPANLDEAPAGLLRVNARARIG